MPAAISGQALDQNAPNTGRELVTTLIKMRLYACMHAARRDTSRFGTHKSRSRHFALAGA